MDFKEHIQTIRETQKEIEINDRDLEIIKANSLDLWTKELEYDIREQRSQHDVQQTRKRQSTTNELTKEDFNEINDLIKTVDKILNLDNIDTNKDNENINKFKKDIKQKYRLSNIDIFKFRLANANCMRCIALFPGIEENLSDITNGEYRITHQQHGVAYNAVFTINDLYYSRKKICNFSDANWITPVLFPIWFTKPWDRLPQYNLRTLVEKSYRVSVQPNIVNYLKADADNLMINIFILFLAFSDGIATLSMYTDPGAEPEYYYKSDSVDMQEVLILFKTHKSTILNLLASELSKAQGQGINPIDILTNMAKDQSGVQPIYIIISSMLDAYSNVYYGKQTTNLSDDLNNEFFQHYQVKFTLFTTMVVTFIKDKLKKKCTFDKCGQPRADKQKDICNKADLKHDINEKRKDTRKINKQRSLDAAKAQEVDLQRQRVVQIINRGDRAARRNTTRVHSGGSTKIVSYLVKIEKIRELNKKLRKNKTKNKSKIEKNNKLIDELKVKIKKQKEKEKLKKQKEKKLEKQKLKKEKDKLKKQKKQKK